MRWLFVFLVFINLFFAIWVSQQPSPQNIQTNQQIINQEIATISLLSEHPEQAKKVTPQLNTQQAMPSEVLAKSPTTCLYIGGVTQKSLLNPIAQLLKKENEAINLTIVTLDNTSHIQLYIKVPSDSDKMADLLKQLNQLAIDYSIMNTGALKDNINLGLFTEENDYKTLTEELANIGIETETKILPASNTSYWLKVLPEQRSLLTEKLLNTLQRTIPSATQELMSCNLAITAKNQE